MCRLVGAASDQQAAETYDQDTFNAGFDEDDDSEAILMEDNDLDDALDDFNQAEMLDDVDSLGQEEDENFAGEEDLNKEVAKDESKLLNGAMDKYHEALSRYNHAVEAVKSKVFSEHISIVTDLGLEMVVLKNPHHTIRLQSVIIIRPLSVCT